MSVTYFRLNRIEKRENNTLYVFPERDDILNANDMLELLDILKNTADSIPFKMIFVLQDHHFYLTKDARDLYKTHEEAKHLILAQAAVFESLTMQILVDLLLHLYAPPYPLKAFKKLETAEKWISGF